MERLNIQDLEVGKIYRAFYKGVEHGIYKIGNNKELFTRVSVKKYNWLGRIKILL